jgi:hypothetical protein
MKFDPKAYEKNESQRSSSGSGGKQYKQVTPGKKTLHGVHFDRYNARSGTKMLRVWFVILKDHTGNGDEGEVVSRSFPLTEKAMFLWFNLCKAIGYLKPHDLADDDDVANVIGRGACEGEVVAEEYNGKTTLKADLFDRFTGRESDEWDAIIEKGRASAERILAKIHEKQASYSAPAPSSYSASSAPDDDIPF